MQTLAKIAAIYILIGAIVVSIGSNVERGCRADQSTFIQCVGFVVIWPLLAIAMSTAGKDFPCKEMNQ